MEEFAKYFGSDGNFIPYVHMWNLDVPVSVRVNQYEYILVKPEITEEGVKYIARNPDTGSFYHIYKDPLGSEKWIVEKLYDKRLL